MIITECLYDSKDELGESPVWVSEHNSIYWIDIKRCKIHKFEIDTLKKDTWTFDETLGSIAHAHDQIFIAATKKGFKFINLKTGKMKPIADPESHLTNNRFNDGKCDEAGRFYSGSMNEKENEPTGSFYVLFSDLTYKKIEEGYIITNGPAFSPDNKKIYYTDTIKGQIYVSKTCKDGLIKEKKLFISIPPNRGKPDGMTVDKKGNLWVAIFGGSCVDCYDSLGKKIDEIKLPVSCVTSCTFGGRNLNTLFITTASFKLNKQEKINQLLAGSLFSINLDTKGNKTSKFKYYG